MKAKVVYLYENMLDEEGSVLFESYHPCYVKEGFIENEDGVKIEINKIWVDFELRNIKIER